MSDSEDAFESADEGSEERTNNRPPDKAPAEPASRKGEKSATGGNNAPKGKKGKRKKGKGAKKKEASGCDGSDQEDDNTARKDSAETASVPAEETAETETPQISNSETYEGSKLVDGSEDIKKTEIKEKLQENEDIVNKMSDLTIQREASDERGNEELKESKSDESDVKRDVTPTRKIERRQKDSNPTQVLDRLSGAAEKQKDGDGGWGWGSWGSSILSTATKSVSTFTSQVGEGFNTVMETVESSLGAPSPEEVVHQQRAVHSAKEPSGNGAPDSNPASDEEEEVAAAAKKEPVKEENALHEEKTKEEDDSSNWFSSWGIPSGITKVVESTTKAVESTSKNLVVGGLDVLETIGKKTYDVLAEGDHGLKKTLKNSGDKPNLSQMLREAKEEADHKAQENEEFEEARKAHYGALFDDFSGLAHLEGLEMVSNQCEGKVQSLLGSLPPEDVTELKPDLINIKDEFDLDQHEEDEAEDDVKEHEFKQLVTEHIGNLGLSLSADKLIQVQGRGRLWLSDTLEEQSKGVRVSAKEIHQMGIQSLAELTACSVESFHKMAQLLQVSQPVPVNTYKFKASNLKILTLVLGTEVDILSSKFSECLNTSAIRGNKSLRRNISTERVFNNDRKNWTICFLDEDDSEEPDLINPLITNIYLEASNSKTYIQDAFQLLLPVLQHAALHSHATT